MSPTSAKLQKDVGRALIALRGMVRAAHSLSGIIERDLSVTATQLLILQDLAANPGQTVKHLAANTHTTHGTVSDITRKLVQKGLVTRSNNQLDARSVVLSLTEAGSNLVARSPNDFQRRVMNGFGRLSAAERKALTSGMEKWLAATRADGGTRGARHQGS